MVAQYLSSVINQASAGYNRPWKDRNHENKEREKEEKTKKQEKYQDLAGWSGTGRCRSDIENY